MGPLTEHLSDRKEMNAALTTRGLSSVSPNAVYCPLMELLASYKNDY